MMTGVNLVHVPFRGNGPALTALLGGQVEVQFATLASSVEFIRTGKLRALGNHYRETLGGAAGSSGDRQLG